MEDFWKNKINFKPQFHYYYRVPYTLCTLILKCEMQYDPFLAYSYTQINTYIECKKKSRIYALLTWYECVYQQNCYASKLKAAKYKVHTLQSIRIWYTFLNLLSIRVRMYVSVVR